jgi:hypothetical protein
MNIKGTVEEDFVQAVPEQVNIFFGGSVFSSPVK